MDDDCEAEGEANPALNPNALTMIPVGLQALYSACKNLYPDQPNPLQVTAKTKYWLGGPDPLDYISMYSHPGDASQNIPPHWHYISFGLSDLHGDGRVHEMSDVDTPSGFGFELTFRLKKEEDEEIPPTWPAPVMQALAKYVFRSDNSLYAGDHVSWHHPLDNSESRIQHILIMEDPQLGCVTTPFGPVNFVQIVGVCMEELQAAQNWNGPGVINLMKPVPGLGGPWLITFMRRGETIFEIDPMLQEAVDKGIETDGSNLTCVSARCLWVDVDESVQHQDGAVPHISEKQSEEIRDTLAKGLFNSKSVLPPIKSHCEDHDIDDQQYLQQQMRKESYDSNASSDVTLTAGELMPTKSFQRIHLQFNFEAGMMLPLAIKGRLRHGRHFTFKSVWGDVAITLVAPSVSGSIVSAESPYTARGPWLQVLIEEDLSEVMLKDLEILNHPEDLTLPVTFDWPQKQLIITITPEFC